MITQTLNQQRSWKFVRGLGPIQKDFRSAASVATLAAAILFLPFAGRAGGVVANCTEADLRAAMAGGGTVTFACDGTITLSNTITSVVDTVLDGSGHQVTISGGGAVQVLNVSGGSSLTLIHLTISNGRATNGANGVWVSPDSATPGGPGGPGGGVYNAGTLTLHDCVVTGNASGNGGNGYAGPSQSHLNSAGGSAGSGGGIYNAGTLTLSNCVVSSNYTGNGGMSGDGDYSPSFLGGTGGSGAGIYNTGTLRLDNSTVNGNMASSGARSPYRGPGADGGSGGGIWSGNSLIASGCTFSGNSTGAGGAGGGTSSFQAGLGGSGGAGGALWSSGNVAVDNCTFSGDSTGAGGAGGYAAVDSGGNGGGGGPGGAIRATGYLALTNCTVVGNSGGLGGAGGTGSLNGSAGPAGYGGGVAASGTAFLLNTIVALNTGNSSDVSGSFLSLGHNLIGATNGSSGFSGAGDLVGSSASPLNPKLGPLTNNGGPTFTVALLPGSPALDAGTTIGVSPTDQRGVSRPQGTGVDIGAFEYQYTVPAIIGAALQGPDFWLQCCGLPNCAYTVQVSTNLLNWSDLSSFISDTNGVFDCADAAQIHCDKRFYRLKYTAP